MKHQDISVVLSRCAVTVSRIICCLPIVLAVFPAANAEAAAEREFRVVLLPDTQCYTESHPEYYLAQTQWIKDHAKQDNIKFVIHLGDLVQHVNDEEEWKIADRAHRILDGSVPYSVLPGNHDLRHENGLPVHDAPLYDKYFPPSRFEKQPWYGGHLGRTNANNYCCFEAAGMKFLVISLEYAPTDATLRWAEEIVRRHADHRIIVATHCYMRTEDRDCQCGEGIGNSGQGIWKNLVRNNPNIFMVVSGHVLGIAHQTSTNDAGGNVHEILCDYQGYPNAGDGWLQTLHFVPAENKICVESYSPVLDKRQQSLPHEYALAYDMSADVKSVVTNAGIKAPIEKQYSENIAHAPGTNAVAMTSSSTVIKPVTRFVRGRVTSAEKPLAAVMVSNGRQIVRTDASGEYTLPLGPDAGRFIFVTCPRGHWTDNFYRPIGEAVSQGRADFALRPLDQPDRFDFVFAADLSNLDNPGCQVGRDKMLASIREICGLSPQPAFLWIQGDLGIIGDRGQFFCGCLKTSSIPVRLGIGNHEIQSNLPRPKAVYESLFGPTYYSFDWGPVHFIVLDGNRPDVNVVGASRGVIEGAELDWLKADLAAQPKGKTIIAGIHIPIVSTYADRRPDLKEEEAPFWISATVPEITALFSKYKVRLVLAGHMHENERTTVDGVEYVTSVSLCGSWWQGGKDFERAYDGVPRGYRIVSIDADKISHRYQSSCESRVERQGEFMNLPGPLFASKATSFVFNCYDAPHDATARMRIDRGDWQNMSPLVLKDSGVIKPHYWQSEVDTTQITPGPHTVEAEVQWPDGTVVLENQEFVLKAGDGDKEVVSAAIKPNAVNDRIIIHAASYNVEYGKNASPEEIGKMFQRYNLDLIGFNEVPGGDWTDRVGKTLGMKFSYVGKISSANHKDKYKSILSRTPLRDMQEYPLIATSGWNPSSTVRAVTTINGADVAFYSLHICASGKDNGHAYILANKVLKNDKSKRIIVVGDFNNKIGDPPISAICDSGMRPIWSDLKVDLNKLFTCNAFMSKKGDRVIDHIFFYSSSEAKTVDGGIIELEKPLSDHKPIWAEISFTP